MFINNNFRGDSVDGFLDLGLKSGQESKNPVISQAVFLQTLAGEGTSGGASRINRMKSIISATKDATIQINGLETNRIEKISFNAISKPTEMTLHCMDVFMVDPIDPDKFGLPVHDIFRLFN
jgi:hypothetical protein